MMRSLTTVVLSLLLAGNLSAQEPRFATTPPAAPLPAVPALAPDLARADAGAGWLRQTLTAVGGAAVGAWVGYMASQVAVGDWEDQSDINREAWAAGGAVFGVTLGLALRGRSAPGAPSAAPAAPSRDVITLAEIREARTATVYEIVRSLRPEWLIERGTGSMRETTRGTASGMAGGIVITQPGIPTVKVYYEDSYLGGVDALRELDPVMAAQIRFLDRAAATQRWGAGHLHGAIQVLSDPPDPNSPPDDQE
jgi:hypothetical protein